MITFLFFIFAVIGVMYAIDALGSEDWSRLFLSLIFAAAFGFIWFDRAFAPPPPPTADQVAQREANKAAEDALKIPQKMSEADGCLVYKFKDNGYWHYFTKCDKDVTTDTTRSVRNGKSTATKIESIVTQR